MAIKKEQILNFGLVAASAGTALFAVSALMKDANAGKNMLFYTGSTVAVIGLISAIYSFEPNNGPK